MDPALDGPRPVTEAEFPAFFWAMEAAFGDIPDLAATSEERGLLPLERTLGFFEGSDVVATCGSYPFELTVPGGSTIPVGGVTGVGVLPTHRRRGLMRSMMRAQLADLAERGDVAAVLNASEGGIYGRFGYGVAQEHHTVELIPGRVEWAVAPPDLRIRLLRSGEPSALLPRVYDAVAARLPGTLSRSPRWWGAVLGAREQWKGGGRLFAAVAEAPDGSAGGYVLYTTDGVGGMRWKVRVREMLAQDAEIESALWRYCGDLDLVDAVEVSGRPLDDPVRWRLEDPRQLRVTAQRDYLWLRILDVCAAMEARAYPADGTVVFAVDDPIGIVSGTYRLEVQGGRGTCARTDEDAGLTMGSSELGGLYLAGVDATTLARAGRVTELESGSLDVAQDVLGWHLRPVCTTRF